MNQIYRPPFWPVTLEESFRKERIIYHEIQDRKKIKIEEIEITPIRLQHPNGCTGFVIKNKKQSIAYLLDNELGIQELKQSASAECESNKDILKSCSIAVMDATYLPNKVIRGFGHSSWKECLDFAKRNEIENVLFSHYCDLLTDEILDSEIKKISADNLKTDEDSKINTCIFAKEGMEFVICENGVVMTHERH